MKFLVILFSKILIFVCDKFGKGTSFPGLIALKIMPGILKSFILPEIKPPFISLSAIINIELFFKLQPSVF